MSILIIDKTSVPIKKPIQIKNKIKNKIKKPIILEKETDDINNQNNIIKNLVIPSESNKLTDVIEEKKPTNVKNIKGSNCSKNGNQYEIDIHTILVNTTINSEKFNTQKISDLGGSSDKNDIECIFNGATIGIEVKICTTPDWMQCSLKYNMESNLFECSKKSKIPKESLAIFNSLLNNLNLYDGNVPPFVKQDITHEEWIDIKKKSTIWNDKYLDIPHDIIKKVYSAKGCKYIQLSKYGLYHLGDDICNFGVPEFIVDQRIRIRIKIHSRKNKKGFCDLSIMAACQPKKISTLNKSPFSLDNKDKLPKNLIYSIVQ
jgi:hypothetical protein